MNPQQAIDNSRFCILDGIGNNEILLEEGIDEDIVDGLIKRGHRVKKQTNEDKSG